MPDARSKRQKLEAMASQTVSPHEAEVARAKLEAMDRPAGKKARRLWWMDEAVLGQMKWSGHFSDDS